MNGKKVKHCIFCYGPTMSGKTEWIQGANLQDVSCWTTDGIEKVAEIILNHESHFVVAFESIELNCDEVERLESLGWSVSFRVFCEDRTL